MLAAEKDDSSAQQVLDTRPAITTRMPQSPQPGNSEEQVGSLATNRTASPRFTPRTLGTRPTGAIVASSTPQQANDTRSSLSRYSDSLSATAMSTAGARTSSPQRTSALSAAISQTVVSNVSSPMSPKLTESRALVTKPTITTRMPADPRTDVQAATELSWSPRLAGEVGASQSRTLFVGKSAPIVTEESRKPQEQEIRAWVVVNRCDVRSEQSIVADILCSKEEGIRVRGVVDGNWLRLVGEPGYMTVRAHGDPSGDEFLQLVDEALSESTVSPRPGGGPQADDLLLAPNVGINCSPVQLGENVGFAANSALMRALPMTLEAQAAHKEAGQQSTFLRVAAGTDDQSAKSSPEAQFKSRLSATPDWQAGRGGPESPAQSNGPFTSFSFQPSSLQMRQDVPKLRTSENAEEVTAWQSEIESIEQTQMQIQTNQMNLLHSQIHILSRELGELQKQCMAMSDQVDAKFGEIVNSLDLTMQEAHTALRLELAKHDNDAEEMKAAMTEVHHALSKAIEDGLSSLSAEHALALDEHARAQSATISDMEGKIFLSLSQRVDADKLELQRKLDDQSTHVEAAKSTLQAFGDLQRIADDHADKISAVTKAVDRLKASMDEAHQALSKAMEEDLGETSAQHTRALKEHAESQAAMISKMEAKLWGDLQKVADDNTKKLASISDENNDKHARHADALESGLKQVLDSSHRKLQADLREFRSGIDESHGNLRNIMANVTQRVDTITSSLEEEEKLRLAAEVKLERTSRELCRELRNDLQTSFQEAHAALKLQLAEQDGRADNVQATVEAAHLALKREMQQSHSMLKGEVAAHAKSSDDRYKNIQDALNSFNDAHHEIHAQNAEKVEASLHNVLGSTHAKLQEELRILKSGGVGSLSSLSGTLTDVTQQVDTLVQAVEKEQDLRRAVETRMDDLLNEQGKMVSELRRQVDATLYESQQALKSEQSMLIDGLADKLESQHQAHNTSLLELQSQLHVDLQRAANDADTSHRELKAMTAKQADTLDQRLEMLESSSSGKQNETLKELDVHSKKIQELYNHMQGHMSKTDCLQTSVGERIDSLERQLKETCESQTSFYGQFRGDSMTRERNATAIESRVSKIETYFTEVTDRHAKEVEAANVKFREITTKFEQVRTLSESHKANIEKRMAYFDKAIADAVESQQHSLSAVHSGHSKEMMQLLHAERAAREAQEKTFLGYINDVREQRDALETSVQEQLKSERVAREVQSQQLKDLAHQSNFQGNAEYTDILLQERSSREAAQRAVERRLESVEHVLHVDRNEREKDMQRLWDAFDGHTHEASIVRDMPGQSVSRMVQSPRTSPRPQRPSSPGAARISPRPSSPGPTRIVRAAERYVEPPPSTRSSMSNPGLVNASRLVVSSSLEGLQSGGYPSVGTTIHSSMTPVTPFHTVGNTSGSSVKRLNSIGTLGTRTSMQ